MAAAMTSFQTHGFKACTIEDIADRAGVFKGSFYNHFKSKEALAVTAVEMYVAEGLKTLPLEGPPSPLNRIKAHFQTLIAIQTDYIRNGCLLANFSAEVSDQHANLRFALENGVNEWCKALAEVIRQGQVEGEIDRRHKADPLARFVINAWEGATVRMKVTQSQLTENYHKHRQSCRCPT
ncbi:MAG: bacterial regulatory s, tetR family protein [Chthoniobacteraceae bacterium]|nr:bacterial regulatory s, tetR family protein [Chthoniobacteraceae bacterium]